MIHHNSHKNKLVDQIKGRLKLEDIVSETVELKRSGSALMGFCPFHSNTNTPAFAVWPRTQTWKCFGSCAAGGDMIDFVMKRDNLGFEEATEELARQANIATGPIWAGDREPQPADWQTSLLELCRQFHLNLFTDAAREARTWLNQRGLTDDTLRRFQVGYNVESRRYGQHYVYGGITIPHYHRSEETLWGVKIRLSQGGRQAMVGHWRRKNPGKDVPEKLARDRYRTVSGTQQNLFNVDELPASQVLVCEGEFDTMLAWQEARDVIAAISLGSASSHMSYQWLRYTLPVRRFYLALDNDGAGRTASRIWKVVVSERGQKLSPPAGKDITDYWKLGHDLRAWLVGTVQPAAPSEWPKTIIYPAGAKIAAPGGQWQRLPDGQIRVVYHSLEELKLCIDISQWLTRENWDGPAAPAVEQAQMFPPSPTYYSE